MRFRIFQYVTRFFIIVGLFGATECTPCPIGFYRNDTLQYRCTACPNGTTTLTQGSVGCFSTINDTKTPEDKGDFIDTPSTSSISSSSKNVVTIVLATVIPGVAILVAMAIVVFLKTKKTKKEIVENVISMEEYSGDQTTPTSIALNSGVEMIQDVKIGTSLGEGHFGSVYKGLWKVNDASF